MNTPSSKLKDRIGIEIVRHRDTSVRDSSGAEGRRLTMKAHNLDARMELTSIERGSGWVYVKPGTYEVEFDYATLGSGRTQVIRILRNPVVRRSGKTEHIDSCLIHAASLPRHLKGCIAPGLWETPDGVRFSKEALQTLFTFLGGFKQGARFEITVREENRSKNERSADDCRT